jgi:hypothetical protein
MPYDIRLIPFNPSLGITYPSISLITVHSEQLSTPSLGITGITLLVYPWVMETRNFQLPLSGSPNL